MKFSVFQVTRKGGRQLNEDRMGYSYTRSSGILLLADGMGGHPEGEVAAQLALQAVSELYQKQANPKIDDVTQFLTSAVMAAHRHIVKYAAEKGMLDTPRTTVVAALVQDGMASWVHCGDSRLYLVRGGKLVVRTRDHSYMEQPLANQTVSRAAERLNRNILFTCLGSPTKPVFDIGEPGRRRHCAPAGRKGGWQRGSRPGRKRAAKSRCHQRQRDRHCAGVGVARRIRDHEG
jgi:serine/threonine protein phosphatase PrpC